MRHEPGIALGRGHRGRGVFATRRFREGDVVERVPTILLEDEYVDGTLNDYVFASRQAGKVVLMLGYGSLYNHSNDPNVYHRTAGRQLVEFVALRDIAPGDELTHDYGPDYWIDRGRTPR